MIQLLWGPVDVDGVIFDTSLTPAETEALQHYAHNAQVLEVGSAFGYSTITMARAGAKHVLAVDPHGGPVSLPSSWEKMTANMNHFGVNEQISRLRSPSQEVLPALKKMGMVFDFVFIDGDHATEVAKHDVSWGVSLLTPTGAIAVHDYGEITCPGVKAALDSLYPEGPPNLIDSLWILDQGVRE